MATVNSVGIHESGAAQEEIRAGRYQTIRRLAGGASGQVFLVEDKTQGTRAVLKVLPMHAAGRDARAEFARLTELAHPNIVRVRDAGILSDGAGPQRAFLVMEYVAGRPLAEFLAGTAERRRLDVFATAAEDLADAVAYLHARGVVHGDISPSNVRCNDAGHPVLIDFGLSLGPQTPTEAPMVSGTLGFISPEALLGERGPAGDLFALGAVLYHAWTGTAPFGVGRDAVRRAWQGPPPAPSTLRPGLPEAWDGLLLRMLAIAAEGRPASAREILREIAVATPGRAVPVEADLAVPYPAGDPLAGLVVGRADEEACLRGHIDRLADGMADVSVVWVAGPVGSGRHTLLRRALRDARLAMLAETMPAFDIEEGECVDLLRRDEAEGASGDALAMAEPLGRSQAEIAGLIARLEARAAQRPLCLALAGSLEDHALAVAVAHGPPSGRLLLLLPCERSRLHSGCAVIELPGLSRESIAELARRGAGTEPSEEVVDRVAAASGGLAGAIAILVRNWIANVREGKPTTFELGDSAQDLSALLDRGFASLAPSTRAFLVAVALDANRHDDVLGDDERAARSAGWLRGETHQLPSALHANALWRAVSEDASLQDVARRASAGLAVEDARLAEVQWALGEREQAAASFWAAMRAAHVKDAWGRVVELGLRAIGARSDTGTCEDRLALAGALGVLGRYDEALLVLDGCPRVCEPDHAMRVIERKAWLLGRQGQPNRAVAIVEAALVGMPPLADAALLLRARLARLLVSRGQFADAIAAAAPAVRADSAAAIPAREATVLALAYAGRLREAREMVDDLARRGGEPLVAARIASLDGLVHQLAGQPSLAAKAYRLAADGYQQLRDLHGEAAATFNLGCVLAEVGNYAAAIEALERAIRDLGRLRALTDHALAVFNVGQLLLQLGDLDAASRSITRLAEDASEAGVEVFRGYTFLLGAELARKRRALAESAASYLEAAEVLARMGMQSMADVAVLARAEVLAELGDLGQAEDVVAKVEARVSAEERRSNPSVGEAIMMARARLAVRDTGNADVTGVAETLAAACDRAQEARRLPAAWQMASLAFQLFLRAGDARQAHHKELAKTLLREVAMKTPAKYWPAMQAQPEARVLDPRGEGPQAEAAAAARVALLEGRLRRLSRINKRLNSDLRLSRVLETIIDTVIELTDAERGFLLLKDGTGELVVKVARNIDQTSLEGPALSLSRSIAKQAAETGQPVITVDAAGDTRFAELLSVSDLHLRSVLAVPLSVKGSVVGTIYVDHRLRKGVFGDDELALLLDFAEQGAIAIENARVVSELRRRERQVQSLNRQLEQELRIKEATLDDVRVELKQSRQLAALRYDYRQIVGQSPAMLELFRLLDRVTDTHLSIVVEGESGTGKELVARAIHFHGPRKERVFVSENCAAIPETLLESTLFGHVRGAFTGADRDSRGLFAVANGGTLFLDEVAEMSPAMQGKLLRVLQDGEYHRVGGERPEKVDVRIVVATNKNLEQLVEEGRFRKDLFYRLGVVRIRLPPLRERQEDIPLLLRHFLDKAAQASAAVPKGIEPAAVERLCRYPWPGNVRELENEIARAGVFAGECISVADLSPHIQAGQDALETVRTDPDNLRLRQRVERLERQLIREAMGRSLGNQTKAAGLLGLSRFGLQKKLRRYNLTG